MKWTEVNGSVPVAIMAAAFLAVAATGASTADPSVPGSPGLYARSADELARLDGEATAQLVPEGVGELLLYAEPAVGDRAGIRLERVAFLRYEIDFGAMKVRELKRWNEPSDGTRVRAPNELVKVRTEAVPDAAALVRIVASPGLRAGRYRLSAEGRSWTFEVGAATDPPASCFDVFVEPLRPSDYRACAGSLAP